MPIPHVHSWRRSVALASCVAALLAAGCGEQANDAQEAKPSVEFVTPTGGDTVARTVSAVVAIERFEIDPEALGEPNEEGVGHLRFTMDRGQFDFPEYSGPNGRLARRLGVDGQYSPAIRPRITYANLPPGEHRLIVDLVNNDYSPVGVTEVITFTVK